MNKILVLVGAVAPWNTDAKDAENPSGNWIQYFTAIVSALQGGQCEGICLHTASLGPDPEILQTDQNLSFLSGTTRLDFAALKISSLRFLRNIADSRFYHEDFTATTLARRQ